MHGDLTVKRKRKWGEHIIMERKKSSKGYENQAKQEIGNSSDRLDYTKLQLDSSLRTMDRN
jgi:hypothetical protein